MIIKKKRIRDQKKRNIQQNIYRAKNRALINAKQKEYRLIKKQLNQKKDLKKNKKGANTVLNKSLNKEILGYVYKITCTINNKTYIGITNNENPENRIKEHFSIKRSSTKLLSPAILKHGVNCFIWEIIDTAKTSVDLGEKEKYYIKKYNTLVPNGYNCTNGGYTINFMTSPVIRMDNKEIYNSIKEAALKNNLKHSQIRSYLCGITNSAGGMYFEYLEEIKNINIKNRYKKE